MRQSIWFARALNRVLASSLWAGDDSAVNRGADADVNVLAYDESKIDLAPVAWVRADPRPTRAAILEPR